MTTSRSTMSSPDQLAADLDRLLEAVRSGEVEASDRMVAYLAGAASAAHLLAGDAL
jgi:hypothetical protein